MSTESIFSYEDELKKLETQQKDLVTASQDIINFVTNPDTVLNPDEVKKHTLGKLTSKLAATVMTLTSHPLQHSSVAINAEGQIVNNPNFEDKTEDKNEKIAASDWKTKLVFAIFIGIFLVVITIAGFVGPQVPLKNPDGSIIYATVWVNGTSTTQMQMSTAPLLPSQWVIFGYLLGGIVATIFFLPGILQGFLTLFAKKPEPTLAPIENLSKHLSDLINEILQEYTDRFLLEGWHSVTKSSVPPEQHYTAETPEHIYSLPAQNRLLFSDFATSRVNQVLFICNGYIRQQRNIIFEHIERVASPSGAAPKTVA
ncbi:MAG: hypothetical protein ACQCN3_02460 [Candidatus Bathyarchaeia archaeon]